MGVSILALSAGGLLALMVFFNGMLAKFIQPLEASLIIHLIGLATSLVLVVLWKHRAVINHREIPKWAYITGIFGGIAVAIVGVTVNGPIGVAGTVGLLVLGQVLYGWMSDTLGLFGTTRRRLTVLDFMQAALILAGVGVLIYG